ncbi:MAG TPA: hypothetical protein VHN16_02850 [Streptosporangiaceae bacterium]|nr:hypothetical protein [Streptosporangiaceae bacterium]
MIDPFTIALIVKAVAVIEIATAVTVLFLNFTQIIDWFEARRTNIPEVDKTKIYFTLLDLLASGDYNTVQGVFDTRTKHLADGVRYRSANIDARLAGYHRNYRLARYE